MAMRTDEQFCQEAFGAYLRVRHSVLPDEWVQEPRGQKTPPDFHLYWHGVTFAVEVTGLMSQYEQTEGASISELGVWKTTERLAQEVEREARNAGLLHGTTG